MISVDELLYETFVLRLEKDGRFNNASIPLENRIMYLNQAQIQLIKSYYGENNIYKLGFEAFKKRIDDLQILVVPDVKLPIKSGIKTKYNKYVVDISSAKDYMLYIQSYITATKGKCKNRVIYNNLVERADIDNYFKSSYNTPSFEWQEEPATIANNTIEVYTDGTYKPEYLYLDYIKYPPKIDKKGYVNFDGTNSIDQNSILPEYLKNDLINTTCEIVASSLENSLQFQLSEKNKINNE